MTANAVEDVRNSSPPACNSVAERGYTLRLGLVGFAHTELKCSTAADQRLGLLMALMDSILN
eukprot:6580544-Pyramimonas_sp.AAC.1